MVAPGMLQNPAVGRGSPMSSRRWPGRDAGDAIPTRANPALVKALARAFRYRRLLEDGRHASISEMAAAEKIERGYLGTLLRLTLLAPDIVEALLEGRHSQEVHLPRLLQPVLERWAEKRVAFGRHAWSQANALVPA